MVFLIKYIEYNKKKNKKMKHLRKFNEEFFYPENYDGQENYEEQPESEEDLLKEEQPLFTMHQLEGAFLSARVVDQEGEPRFENFREWYMSELGSSVDMRDYAFDKHTKSPFNQYSYIF